MRRIVLAALASALACAPVHSEQPLLAHAAAIAGDWRLEDEQSGALNLPDPPPEAASALSNTLAWPPEGSALAGRRAEPAPPED